ncbi:N-acetylmuramoyl-L-alanine amidase [Dyadobacter sandarakinus]|uniref:N-acetylmuramoyl-L-alanine amidase n=2 Tax=Dyadobacter sandarakinus TaxID=2747268 RepID=A0ABX7IDP9_9BACT|nr:N-acetylmuramoyl-L-alanine amidase [Dyadobacter sandarakinus]
MRAISLACLAILFLQNSLLAQTSAGVLTGKTICIDPGHGGTASTDSYRVGPAGEREEWINLRVGLVLQKMLQEKGAMVIMTRTEDQMVSLTDRSRMALDNKADLFVSIHHNATADSSVNFPIIYFHGNQSENLASVMFGKALAAGLIKHLYKKQVPVSLVSDFTIFADAGASVLRNSYGTPAVLAEASFFTNAAEEQLLKQESYNHDEALAYTEAILMFFSKPVPRIIAKNSRVPVIPSFKVFQEAERMTPIAKRWKQDYEDGMQLITTGDSALLNDAYELFTRSVRSFPDSYLAAQCHHQRATLLEKMKKPEEARQEEQRFRQYYVVFP